MFHVEHSRAMWIFPARPAISENAGMGSCLPTREMFHVEHAENCSTWNKLLRPWRVAPRAD